MIDIPSRILIADNSRVFYILRSFNVFDFNKAIYNFICTISDIAVSLDKNSINYFMYSSLFPNNISSIENAIIHFKLTDFYPFICYYEPMYFIILPNIISNLLHTWLMCNNHLDLFESMKLVYKNGYDMAHLPSLSGFWYLMMCMVEQYSKFSYTLILIYGNYLIKKNTRLFPIFKGSSTFNSYLPVILNSRMIDLYCIFGMVFEYVYMEFKRTMVTNTNFIFWSTLIFVILYVLDLKYGKFLIKNN